MLTLNLELKESQVRNPQEASPPGILHQKGRLHCDFLETIRMMPRIIDSSCYRTHLERWIEMFGPEDVLIILQDDTFRPISSRGRSDPCDERVPEARLLSPLPYFRGVSEGQP